jgi:hypothetical protein
MPKLSILNGRAFDAGLAALAAASAGFVAFAMPEPLFSGLVETSRLPDLLAAAQPPLGQTARLAAVGAAALVTFSSVWGLMAAIGRVPIQRKPEAEPEAEAPRLRRADAHPDAPARRLLLARDLGEPLDLDDFPKAESEAEEAEFEPAEAETAGHRPLPGFLVPQAPEPEPLAETILEESEAEPEAAGAGLEWLEADSAPDPDLEPEPMQQPPIVRPAEAGPLPLSELAAQLPRAEADPDQSLSQLVNRIEFGLSRKRQALPAADLPPVEDAPVEPEKVGHRLRSAINDLQKIASTGA